MYLHTNRPTSTVIEEAEGHKIRKRAVKHDVSNIPNF
jgi:hypothetical protein